MSNSETQQQYNMSWGMIVVWIFLFFPVAIYFSIRKRNAIKDIDYYIKECNGYMVLGAIMVVLSLPNLTDLGDDPKFWTTLAISLGMLIGGLALLLYNFKSKSMYREYIQYIGVLKNDESGTISSIADAIGKTPQQALEDLEKMIKKDILADTYIDYSMRKIVGPIVGSRRKSRLRSNLQATQRPVKITARPIKCPNCGAQNTLTKVGQSCAYCDTLLE